MHFFKHKKKTILQHPMAKIYLNGNQKNLLCLCQDHLQSNSIIAIIIRALRNIDILVDVSLETKISCCYDMVLLSETSQLATKWI